MNSILNSIKKLLGPTEDYTQFDTDIIMHINSAFAVLGQLGIGPDDGFVISDDSTTWDEYLQDEKSINFIKTYIYLKVKLQFDTTTMSSTSIESFKEMVNEYEWRMTVAADEIKARESEANEHE